jgi:hypothetical protein
MSISWMPVIISYRSCQWIKVGLRSFRHFFPDSPILIIDNNPDPGMVGYNSLVEVERTWLKEWRSQDRHHHFDKAELFEKNHGLAMDRAVRWCRANAIRWMLHFEPDCVIDGVEWANRLLNATSKDIWMAGSYRKSYGPIHPTPSVWDVNQVKSSFREQLRGSDVKHPRFHDLMDMRDLMSQTTVRDRGYWTSWWDTAQKPWFDAAIHDKALLVEESPDFKHFWMGSTHNTDPSKTGDSRVTQYL